MDWQQGTLNYESIPISNQEFNQLSGLMYRFFGINLNEKKKILVKTRLNQYLVTNGYSCFEDFYQALITTLNPILLLELVDKLSTNYTFFFREPDHFHFILHTILPQIQDKQEKSKTKTIRIWSAGCSSGEEAYSLAILLHDYFTKHFEAFDIKILATDISVSVLKKAKQAVYPEETLKNIPSNYRQNYFNSIKAKQYQVKDKIREMVTVRRLNLMSYPFPFHEQFDIIFCRNVMIYFDEQSRRKLIEKYYQHTKKGGYLIIGHSESLSRKDPLFQYIQPSIYRKE